MARKQVGSCAHPHMTSSMSRALEEPDSREHHLSQRYREALEKVMSDAVNSALSTMTEDPIVALAAYFHPALAAENIRLRARVEELESLKDEKPMRRLWKDLAEHVRTSVALHGLSGPAEPQETSNGATLHAKFLASGEAFTFSYGGVEQFFGGLEGLVGTPSPDFLPTMVTEHASDQPFDAWNAGEKRSTTPNREWLYIAEGRSGEAPFSDRDKGHPVGWRLVDFVTEIPEMVQAGVLLPEMAGLRLCTLCHKLKAQSPGVRVWSPLTASKLTLSCSCCQIPGPCSSSTMRSCVAGFAVRLSPRYTPSTARSSSWHAKRVHAPSTVASTAEFVSPPSSPQGGSTPHPKARISHRISHRESRFGSAQHLLEGKRVQCDRRRRACFHEHDHRERRGARLYAQPWEALETAFPGWSVQQVGRSLEVMFSSCLRYV